MNKLSSIGRVLRSIGFTEKQSWILNGGQYYGGCYRPEWTHSLGAVRHFSRSKSEKDAFRNKGTEELSEEDWPEPESDAPPPWAQPGGLKKGSRVKVKFDWKNSLVTADAVNLLENLYKTRPELIEFSENDLIQYLQQMAAFAIDVNRASDILLLYPNILRASMDKLSTIFMALRTIGFSEKQRSWIINRIPQIVDAPPKKITKQFGFLKTYLTTEETLDAVGKSVEILLESESSLRAKLDYLIKDMSHETKNIVSCKVLSYPLKRMQSRHEFLIRTGFFKPIPYRKLIKVLEKEYKDRNKARLKYFRPVEVVCYRDDDFLKTCTHNTISINELAAFEELYEAEMEDIEDDRSADSDADDDDELDYDDPNSAVISIKNKNSIGFFNDVEANSCYF